MNKPHPTLEPLLLKYDISWEMFLKRGRPPQGVREKRSAIITELHSGGMSWASMIEVTGLSNGAIQRLTGAMWNEASKKNRQESAVRMGHARKGETKPWLSAQMKQSWENGLFDFHKGRVRPLYEIQKIRDSFTPERRCAVSKRMTTLWQQKEYKARLLSFHRSLDERCRRSQAQSFRIVSDPIKWTRGRGSYLEVSHCENGSRIWVRSTYEKAAVSILERDPDVISYKYEERIVLADGFEIRPDFIVNRSDGMWLIEVKASWVLELPTMHKVSIRLDKSKMEALKRGWHFSIWTEKDTLSNVLFPK